MKFGSNYASLRIPYGVPLKVVQFRFGEYVTEDAKEIEMLQHHPEVFVMGGGEDGTGSRDGDKEAKPVRKGRNTKQRINSDSDGQ